MDAAGTSETSGTMTAVTFAFRGARASGYVAYSDHHAMQSDLNALLLGLDDAEQCRLVGFGVGFLDAVTAHLEQRSLASGTHRLSFRATTQQASMIDALQRLQESGTDNAPPSTHNLLSALHAAHAAMSSGGAIRTSYWDGKTADAALPARHAPTSSPQACADQVGEHERRGRAVGGQLI